MFDEIFHREKKTAPAPDHEHVYVETKLAIDGDKISKALGSNPGLLPDIANKLESIEQIVRATAWAVLYIGQRQEKMSVTSDALTQLENAIAALEQSNAGVVNAAHAGSQVAAEAANDAQRIQQLIARVQQLEAQNASVQPAA